MRARGVLGLAASAAGLALVLGAAKPRARRHEAPPPPPPPDVALSLDAPAPDRDWTVTLTNNGADPVRIVASPYLLSFDVTSAGRSHRCVLPADMRPRTDVADTLLVPPGRSWSAYVDPVLYCFGAAAETALAPGATVVAHFGFTSPRYAPPFAITPIGGDGGAGPAQSLSAPVVTLAAAQTPDDAGAADAGARPPGNAYPVDLAIKLPARFDMVRSFEVSVPVTIVNEGNRPVRSLFTAPAVGFLVQTPSGHVYRCGGNAAASAIAELVSTLYPRRRITMSIDIGAVCGTYLQRPGLYRVWPRLDTRRTTPPPGSAPFWNGKVVGAPMFLRVREGDAPTPLPELDPAPQPQSPQ